MPYKEKKINKLYYSIGEVSEMLEINASTIRYWEGEFSVLKPRKNRKGDRLFTDKDIDILKIIYTLVKKKGYTVEGARKHLKENKNKDLNKLKAIKKLESIKMQLVKLKEAL